MSRESGEGTVLKAITSKPERPTSTPASTKERALVLVSLNNPYCTGEYLDETIKLACSSHKEVIILVADELHRHNLRNNAASESTEGAEANRAKAISLGDKFIQDNLGPFLEQLDLKIAEFQEEHPNLSSDEQVATINRLAVVRGKNFKIMRWHEWVNQPPYLGVKKTLEARCTTDAVLQSTIDKVALNFARRHTQKNPNEKDAALWFERSKHYLQEEAPALGVLPTMLGFNSIMYPGAELDVFKKMRSSSGLGVRSAQPSTKWVEVKFTRAHQNSSPIAPLQLTKRNSLFAKPLLRSHAPLPTAVIDLAELLLASNRDQPADVKLAFLIAALNRLKPLAMVTPTIAGPSSPPTPVN